MVRIAFIFLACLVGGVLPAFGGEAKGAEKVWRNPKDGMEFVWIPAGSFRAEVPKKRDGQTEYASEQVTFGEGFWMGRTEVTVGQFRRFVEATGHVTEAEKAKNRWTWKEPGFAQGDDHPVVYIGFTDALRYAEWAGVDLPTDGEWFYACRAGTTTVFYWGEQMDDRYVWHRGNAGDGTRAVGQKLPNPWGLHDMVGNAYEWCKGGKDIGIPRGGAWTRCDKYVHLSGGVVEPFSMMEMSPRLHDGSAVLQYPWDDDRGFRCVKRVNPAKESESRGGRTQG